MHNDTDYASKAPRLGKPKGESWKVRAAILRTVADHDEGGIDECLLRGKPVDHLSPLGELRASLFLLRFRVPMEVSFTPCVFFAEPFNPNDALWENDAPELLSNERFGESLLNPVVGLRRDEKWRKRVCSPDGLSGVAKHCWRSLGAHADIQPFDNLRCLGSETLAQVNLVCGVAMYHFLVISGHYPASLAHRLFPSASVLYTI